MLFKFSGIGQLPRLATTCIDGVQIPVADVFLRRSIEDRALALKRRIGFCGNLEMSDSPAQFCLTAALARRLPRELLAELDAHARLSTGWVSITFMSEEIQLPHVPLFRGLFRQR